MAIGAKRFPAVADLHVQQHQGPPSGLPIRLEAEQLLGDLDPKTWLAVPAVEIHEAIKCPHELRLKNVAAGVDPRSFGSGQKRPAEYCRGDDRRAVSMARVTRPQSCLGFVQRLLRHLDIHPCVVRQLHLVAAESRADRGSIMPGRVQNGPKLADDGCDSGRPSHGQTIWPEEFREFGVTDRPAPFPNQVGEGLPPLTPGEPAFADQDAIRFDTHLTGQVDPHRRQTSTKAVFVGSTT